VYRDVLDGMRRNESVVIDTRLNFTYGLPKKARIPRTREEWRSMQNEKGKLTNNYAQIDSNTVKIDGDLTLVDVQPVRADNNNYRYQKKEDEIEARLLSLPRAALLGSPISIANHPAFGTARNFRTEVMGTSTGAATTISTGNTPVTTIGKAEVDEMLTEAGNDEKKSAAKKPSLAQEWIFWVRDSHNRHYPMTVAAFAHMYRTGQIPSIVLHSFSGWTMFSDEDRIFVVPKHFINPSNTAPTCATATSAAEITPAVTTPAAAVAAVAVTPAVKLSKSVTQILPELQQPVETPVEAPKPAPVVE